MSLETLRSSAIDPNLIALDWKPSVAQVPSPSWWASDSDIYSATDADGLQLLAKVVSAQAWAHRNLAAALEAGRVAGEHGLGPAQVAADTAAGVVVYEKLDDSWRVGRLDLILNGSIRQKVLETRKAFQRLSADLPTRNHFAELDDAEQLTRASGALIDPRLEGLLGQVREYREALEERLAKRPIVSSAGEGTVSNFMLNTDGGVQLVGWGSACSMTDVADLATLAAEFTPTLLSVDQLVSEFFGEADGEVSALVELLAVVDDVRWALILTLRAHIERNPDLDVTKYALWRMTKAEIALGDGARIESLRKVLA